MPIFVQGFGGFAVEIANARALGAGGSHTRAGYTRGRRVRQAPAAAWYYHWALQDSQGAGSQAHAGLLPGVGGWNTSLLRLGPPPLTPPDAPSRPSPQHHAHLLPPQPRSPPRAPYPHPQ